MRINRGLIYDHEYEPKSPHTRINPSLNHTNTLDHVPPFISHFFHSFSQIDLVPVNYNYLLQTSTLEIQWQSVLVVWAAFTTCGRHSLRQAKLRLPRIRTHAANAAWTWGTFAFFFFSIARLVFTFFLLLINCAHRYSHRCHGSLVSVSRSYSPVSVRKKKRYSIFDIEIYSYCIGLSVVYT